MASIYNCFACILKRTRISFYIRGDTFVDRSVFTIILHFCGKGSGFLARSYTVRSLQ